MLVPLFDDYLPKLIEFYSEGIRPDISGPRKKRFPELRQLIPQPLDCAVLTFCAIMEVSLERLSKALNCCFARFQMSNFEEGKERNEAFDHCSGVFASVRCFLEIFCLIVISSYSFNSFPVNDDGNRQDKRLLFVFFISVLHKL